MQQPADSAPTPSTSQNIEVIVHASPKFWPFMGVGPGIGIIIAIIVAITGPESAEFTRASVAGFFAVGFGVAGVFLAGIVFVVVDRITLKRGRRATAVPTGDPEHS